MQKLVDSASRVLHGALGDDMMIMVMGPTGVGKSSFINTVSGSRLPVSGGLKSCTSNIMRSECFLFSGRRVVLIDTPGFDDTKMSDVDILNTIALFLSTMYEQRCKLSGIIYMHRISDSKVGGTARRNLAMLRELCGTDAFPNVAFVTSMWDDVEPERGASREKELAVDDQLFWPMLSKGSKLLRYKNSIESGEEILSQLLHIHPITLQIQRELVDQGRKIADTSAGKRLLYEQVELMKQHAIELKEAQDALEVAVSEKDVQAKQELKELKDELEGELQRVQRDHERLSADYVRQKKRIHPELEKAKADLHRERNRRQLADGGFGQPPGKPEWSRPDDRRERDFVDEKSSRSQHGFFSFNSFVRILKIVDLIINIHNDIATW